MQLFYQKRRKTRKTVQTTTVYKSALVRRVAQQTQRSQPVVQQTLTAALDLIAQALARGERVTLPGFGTFYTRTQPKGTVRHIRTKATVSVPPRRVAAFRVGEVLKRQVRGVASQPGVRQRRAA